MSDTSDPSDQASQYEENFTQCALLMRKPVYVPTGLCHSCGDPVDGWMQFCDKDCATDWQRARDARERNK